MHVMVLGIRGIPGIAGGTESHAEHLYPLLAELGCEVEVVARSTMQIDKGLTHWRGVRLKCLWSPTRQGLEAFAHTFLGVLYAAVKRPDLVHIHAVGPMFMTPLARMLGLRVVVTHHGPDYDREKWGEFSRYVLRTGERFGALFANEFIVISDVIRKLILEKHRRETRLIPNGVAAPDVCTSKRMLSELSLVDRRYVLHVGRYVPEKRQGDLIEAFELANLEGWKLVLVGEVREHERYSQQIVTRAQNCKNVVLAGFRTGADLQELYTRAGMFVLPSSHEGLPIVMLEALSYGLPVLASDIPANLEVGLTTERYFPLGDARALASSLQQVAAAPHSDAERSRTREWALKRYDWREIAQSTLAVYMRATAKASLNRRL